MNFLPELKTYLPGNLRELDSFAEAAVDSGLFDKDKHMSPNQKKAVAVMKLMAGASWGIPPFSALANVHVIKGTPAIGANLQRAMVRQSGRYDYRIRENTDQVCRIEWFEKLPDGSLDSLGFSSFTIEEAKKADLTKKDNWRNYPKAMLLSRATSIGTKAHCPDVFFGNVYDPEELETIDVQPVRVESRPVQPQQPPQDPGDVPSVHDVCASTWQLVKRLPQETHEVYAAQLKDIVGKDDLDQALDLHADVKSLVEAIASPHKQPPCEDSLGGEEAPAPPQQPKAPVGGQHKPPQGSGSGLKRPALRRPARSAQ